MKNPQKRRQLWMSCTFSDWLTYTTFKSSKPNKNQNIWHESYSKLKLTNSMTYSLISHNINTTRCYVVCILLYELLWAVLNCQHFSYELLLFSSGIYVCCQWGNSAPPIESLLACFLLITVCGPAPLPPTSADIHFLLTSPSPCTV